MRRGRRVLAYLANVVLLIIGLRCWQASYVGRRHVQWVRWRALMLCRTTVNPVRAAIRWDDLSAL